MERIERDTIGEMRVPEHALYGAQTARAVENFPISGRQMPRAFLRAMALIKAAAARVNLSITNSFERPKRHVEPRLVWKCLRIAHEECSPHNLPTMRFILRMACSSRL